MFEHLTQFLELHILPWGWWGVFAAAVAEEVVAPIPSALVMMTAGFLFVTGPVGVGSILKLILYVGLPAAVGVTIGSLWIYGVAYWGGRRALDKFGKWIGLSWEDVEKMRIKFEASKGDEFGIIGARVVPFVPSVAISAFCGFIRMKFWKYCTLTFIGMFLRAMLMGAIGWQVGNVYHRYAETIARFEKLGLVLIILAGLLFIGVLFWKRKMRYSEPNGEI
jgi:membrane protein DedA with SNARE-associated domain